MTQQLIFTELLSFARQYAKHFILLLHNNNENEVCTIITTTVG